MTDWESGFTAGVAATIVGFVLTMIWDGYKYRRDVISRESSLIKGLIHELYENRELATENKDIIKGDLESLKTQKTLLRPLLILKSGFWDYLKFNIPNKLLKNTDLLEKLKNISLLAEHINETIRSRQNYKDTSSAMIKFGETIKTKDNIIDSDLTRFNKSIDDVLSELEAI